MALSQTQIDKLLAMIAATRSEEMDCDACLGELAEFVESESSSSSSPKEIFAEVREHLACCGECTEEYETLMLAVTALEGEA